MMDQPLKMINKKSALWRCALLAIPLASSTLLSAQGAKATQASSPQAAQSAIAQVQVLTNRVAYLEQRLAALGKKVAVDEASGLNNPQTATPVGGDEPPSASLSKADKKSLADMNDRLNKLEAGQHRITAPFKIVDSNDVDILDVEEGGGDDFRGMRVYAKNDSFVQIAQPTGAATYASLSIHRPGRNISSMFFGLRPGNKPGIIIVGDQTGNIATEITEEGGHGVMNLNNPAGQTVAIIGSNPTNSEGHAKFMDAGGNSLAAIGAAGTHGDVILTGDGKGVPVWEFMLTGFH